MTRKYRLQGKQIINFKFLIFAIKHNNSLLVISLFIMVNMCFGHSWQSSGQLIET